MQLIQATKKYNIDFLIRDNHYNVTHCIDYIEISELTLLDMHNIYIRFYETDFDNNEDIQIGERVQINEKEYDEIMNNTNFDFLPYIRKAYENEIKEYKQKIERVRQKIKTLKG